MENSQNHSSLWKNPTTRHCAAPGAAFTRRVAGERPTPSQNTSQVQPRGEIRAAWLAYAMSRSGAGGMRGGEGERTSPPVTVS